MRRPGLQARHSGGPEGPLYEGGMARLLLTIVLCFCAVVTPANQQRDGATPPAAGTAVIAGTVVTDATPPVPARRAVLVLTNVAGGDSRTTVSDDRGRFTFDVLPAGRFMLSASKGGYAKTTYGATRPGGAGVPLALVNGQRTTGLVLTLVRGGVITGTLRDRRGAPMRDAIVYATRPGVLIDHRTGFTNSDAGGMSVTDDRGIYRIFGLRQGEYLVWTEGPFWIEESATRLTTTEDLQRARQLIQTGRAGAPAPPPGASAPTPPSGPTVRFADSYYPSTATPADAVPVRVGPGEERAGIDFQLLLVPSARLAGAVVDPAGRPPKNVRLSIRPVAIAGNRQQINQTMRPDGTFDVPHITPGEYVLTALANIGVPDGTPLYAPDGSARSLTHWARLDLTVTGTDQTDLALRLQPTLKVSGRIVFESGGLPPPDPAGLAVMLFEAGLDRLSTIPQARTNADGSFVIEGVAAARYHIEMTRSVSRGRTLPGGWMVKSIAGAGPDLADVPLEVKPDADVTGLVITLTSRTTELAGTLQDAVGRPATAYTVVAFSTDRAYWVLQSRRIQATRPADDGAFAIRNLPAGEYFLAALTDVDDGQWFEPGFLSTLVASGVKVTIVEGQRTVQNLQIAK